MLKKKDTYEQTDIKSKPYSAKLNIIREEFIKDSPSEISPYKLTYSLKTLHLLEEKDI